MSKPYYENELVRLFNCDCRKLMFNDPKCVSLVLADPPYGISLRTSRNGRVSAPSISTSIKQRFDWEPIHGDNKPFDPSWLLECFQQARIVLFGANHYASKLPDCKGWIFWDKTGAGRNVSDQADGELAWTNCLGAVRGFSHLWKGCLKDSERRDTRVHPTQKPIALMEWIINKLTNPGDLVYDPYAGGGSTLIAAQNLGRRAIGCEIVEHYCKVTSERLEERRVKTSEVVSSA